MSALAIVLVVYVAIGMAKLSYVLYGGSAGKDVDRHNARLFDQVRAGGPLAILIGMAAEILLWPYGIYLGYHVVRQMSLERRSRLARAEQRCKGELRAIGQRPPEHFISNLRQREVALDSPELQRAIANGEDFFSVVPAPPGEDPAKLAAQFPRLDYPPKDLLELRALLDKAYNNPEGRATPSEELKAKIARDVREALDREDEELG